MELHERIKVLRKDYLKLSQEAFGEKLGTSRSVINNIERNVLARPEQKEPIYKLICETFNVNENWLKYGEGEIFVQDDTFSLDDYLELKKATNLEKEIVKAYFSLPENMRQDIINHFKEYFLNEDKKDDKEKEHSEIINPNALTDDEIEKELEAYRLELEAERRVKTSSVSEDTKRKKA